MKSDFEERRQARKDRYEELADKNRQQSEERYDAARMPIYPTSSTAR